MPECHRHSGVSHVVKCNVLIMVQSTAWPYEECAAFTCALHAHHQP